MFHLKSIMYLDFGANFVRKTGGPKTWGYKKKIIIYFMILHQCINEMIQIALYLLMFHSVGFIDVYINMWCPDQNKSE